LEPKPKGQFPHLVFKPYPNPASNSKLVSKPQDGFGWVPGA